MQNRKLIVPAAVPELEAAYFSLEFTGDLWRHSRMNTSSADRSFTRRRFIAAAGLALAAPAFVPASVLGRGGAVAPSERVVMGVVGWGMQGPGNTHEFLKLPDCQVVAACDLDQKHLDAAVNSIKGKYGNKDCRAYHDFREIWGVKTLMRSCWRCRYLARAHRQWKPRATEGHLRREALGPTIAEQQAIVKAVQKNKRVWQNGFLAAFRRQSAAPPRSFATGSSESCNASK